MVASRRLPAQPCDLRCIPVDHAISDDRIAGFPVVTLESPHGGLRAAFAPSVGMVCCSLTHRGEELLGQRKGLAAYAETGSSMGIPVLHPWANRLAGMRYRAGDEEVRLDPGRSPLRLEAGGLPIHGLLAASPHWEVVERHAGQEGARLEARFAFDRPELLAAFPFPHELRLAALLTGAVLRIRLELRATGDRAVPVTFGFHPYFRLPGVPRAEWAVELPVRRRALLDERGIPTGRTAAPPFSAGPLGERDFDDLFPELAHPARFALEGGGRRITVEFAEGYPVAQVYGGPTDDFICFEPMSAQTNALVSGDGLRCVEPGRRHVAEFSLRVDGSA